MPHATHSATIVWQRDGARFTDKRYSRGHVWRFDGGLTVPASSSPHVVPVPYSEPGNIDPEEAFVAAIASCHMLWFLDFAARAGFVVDSYRDEAVARMGVNESRKLWVEEVSLRPQVMFSGEKLPSESKFAAMHEQSHEACFIANSVRTRVLVQPSFGLADPSLKS